jgi:hypothetical protein
MSCSRARSSQMGSIQTSQSSRRCSRKPISPANSSQQMKRFTHFRDKLLPPLWSEVAGEAGNCAGTDESRASAAPPHWVTHYRADSSRARHVEKALRPGDLRFEDLVRERSTLPYLSIGPCRNPPTAGQVRFFFFPTFLSRTSKSI